MPEYKIYKLDERGKIDSPPEIVNSDYEPDVVARARKLATEGRDVEVWQSERLVIHLLRTRNETA